MTGFRHRAVGVLAPSLLATLFATIRVRRIGTDHFEAFRRERKPVLFVFWHGQLLPLVHAHRREGIVVLVSEHGDGEYVTRIIERNGFGTVRGSTTRGGTTGLRALVREARAGHDLALTPDGPQGPRGVFKPGALYVAQLTGLPVIPLVVRATRGWRLGSWDGFLVPKPLASIEIEYLPARFVPRDATRSDLEGLAGAIGTELLALTGRWIGAEETP